MMNRDDARSDFVLAAAGAFLLPLVASLIASIPFYPDGGSWFALGLDLLWLASFTMLVPWVIARHREQGAAAFDLTGKQDAIRRGTIIALPIVLFGTLRAYSQLGSPSAALGLYALPLGGDPTIGEFDLFEFVARILGRTVVIVGSVVFAGFLINRARDAFAEVDIPVVEALRTFGMGAAAASLLMGLLLLLRQSIGLTLWLGSTAVLVLLVLLADRLVYANMSTTRAAILAPGIVTVVLHVFSFGGLFRGDLAAALWFSSLGFGLMVVAACLAGTRATKLAWVMPVAATGLWPTCLSPIGLQQGMSAACFAG